MQPKAAATAYQPPHSRGLRHQGSNGGTPNNNNNRFGAVDYDTFQQLCREEGVRTNAVRARNKQLDTTSIDLQQRAQQLVDALNLPPHRSPHQNRDQFRHGRPNHDGEFGYQDDVFHGQELILGPYEAREADPSFGPTHYRFRGQGHGQHEFCFLAECDCVAISIDL